MNTTNFKIIIIDTPAIKIGIYTNYICSNTFNIHICIKYLRNY